MGSTPTHAQPPISPTSPISLSGGLTLRNRVALAPMTNGQSHEDGTLGADEMHWLMLRAKGGFGSVVTCAAHVRADAQGFEGELGVFDDRHVEGLSQLAAAMREQDCACFVQLYHGGARCPSRLTGVQPVSASAYVGLAPGFETPRELAEDEIKAIVSDFATAAARCAKAGLPGVEIHGANGYLITQFLSTQSNLRTDSWGGSLENRARLAREIVRAVRASTRTYRGPKGEGFVVGLRLSPENAGSQTGLSLGESLEVARLLVQDGLDYLHLSLGDFRKTPSEVAPGQSVALPAIVSSFRDALPANVALMTSGGIWTARDASEALALGADVVSLGKAGISHADWPRLALDDAFEPTRFPQKPERLEAQGVAPSFLRLLRLMRLVDG